MTGARTGTTFLRRYELVALVGGGDAAVVYRAVDTLHARDVTLTMQDPTQVDSLAAAVRIRREAEVLDALRHRAVPRVYEYGDAPLGDGTTISYAVTEPSAGEPLPHRLAGGPLPWPEAVQVAGVVAEVLAIAHHHGFVHGGLTAAHVLLAADGPTIVGFGAGDGPAGSPAARGSGTADPSGSAGTADGSRGTAADDVYALGVLLHQMVTGRLPHQVADPAATPQLADLTPGVADIVRWCMRRRPLDRPRAVQLVLDLRALVMPISVPMNLQTVPGWLLDEVPAIEDRTAVDARAESALPATPESALPATPESALPATPGSALPATPGLAPPDGPEPVLLTRPGTRSPGSAGTDRPDRPGTGALSRPRTEAPDGPTSASLDGDGKGGRHRRRRRRSAHVASRNRRAPA